MIKSVIRQVFLLFEFTGLVGETQEVIGGDIIILSEGLDMVAGDISHTALVGAVILICRVEYVGDFFLRFFVILSYVTKSLIIVFLHNFNELLLLLSLKFYHICLVWLDN